MPTDRVFLTGASGFVGSHILRELLNAGYSVRALARDRHPEVSKDPEPFVKLRTGFVEGRSDKLEIVAGDLTRVGDFARSLEGCRYVVHCAALYSFAPRDRAAMEKTNVRGTAGLMEAARVAGVERVVLTSSTGTLHESHSAYHRSKVLQERAAFAGRVPVVALLPSAPVGPGDWKPTPTGKLVLDFTCGRIFVKPPHGGLNMVPVEDVARAHVTALERGRPGERYILGGEDLTFDRVWELLSAVTGRPLPRGRIPYPLLIAIASVDEVRSRLFRADPLIPLEGVRLSRELMYADSTKAARELDFHPGSVKAALERAVEWYRAHGYCS
ncbi:MAG TPA: NAD-dependent epimerase/dehydratase family protein [Candidatus Rubrimentiphilum sp.]|nr:NAD-dependent epimerase/dehydratase family protein [Candidatus Rubrimentiphilum sp.]